MFLESNSQRFRSLTFFTLLSHCNLLSLCYPIDLFDTPVGFTVGALRHSLQERLSKGAGVHSSGRTRADEIYLKLRTSTGLASIFYSLFIFFG